MGKVFEEGLAYNDAERLLREFILRNVKGILRAKLKYEALKCIQEMLNRCSGLQRYLNQRNQRKNEYKIQDIAALSP